MFYNQSIRTGGRMMRKLSIEKMETIKDMKKVEAVVGTSFERSKNAEEIAGRSESLVANTIGGWSRIICFSEN